MIWVIPMILKILLSLRFEAYCVALFLGNSATLQISESPSVLWKDDSLVATVLVLSCWIKSPGNLIRKSQPQLLGENELLVVINFLVLRRGLLFFYSLGLPATPQLSHIYMKVSLLREL